MSTMDPVIFDGAQVTECPLGKGLLTRPFLQVDKWTSGQWTAWRITTDINVNSYFSNYDAVVAREVSDKGVVHYHALTLGPKPAAISKRISRKYHEEGIVDASVKKLWWSCQYPNDKKPDSTLEKGIAYTIKGGDYNGYGALCNIKYDYSCITPWVFRPKPVVSVLKQTIIPTAELEEKEAAKERRERSWQLHYGNIVIQASKYAKRHALTGSLKETLRHMLKNTKWRPCRQMVRHGETIPEFYKNDYESAMGRRAEPDMSWV